MNEYRRVVYETNRPLTTCSRLNRPALFVINYYWKMKNVFLKKNIEILKPTRGVIKEINFNPT